MYYNVGKTIQMCTSGTSVSGCSSDVSSISKSTVRKSPIFGPPKQITESVEVLSSTVRSESNRYYGAFFKPGTFTNNMLNTVARGMEDTISFALIDINSNRPIGIACTGDGNEPITDPKNQVPWWCLRPYDHINIEALIAGGLISNEDTAHDRQSGYKNTREGLLPRKRIDINSTTRLKVSGNGTDIVLGLYMRAEYQRYVELPVLSEMHLSVDEWNPILGGAHHCWHVNNYLNGDRNSTPEELVDEVVKYFSTCKESLMVFGGNWKCRSETDSIRIMCALSEAVNWDSALSSEHPFIQCGETRVYVKWVPFIYESPQHRDHPASAMVLSKTPIEWWEIK